MDGTIGEIRLFAGNFAPKDWNFCDGSIMAIRSNTALFSILGTMYGGDGRTTFGLPNFTGRVVVGQGTGPGLTQRDLGEMDGSETNVMTINEMAMHAHTGQGTVNQLASTKSTTKDPVNNYPGVDAGGALLYGKPGNVLMGSSQVNVTVGVNGGGQAFGNLAPYLGLNYIICMYGVFPDRP